MMQKHSKIGHRKVSPPGPTYMSDDQVANYLKDLRTNRPARPTGSRPYPGKSTQPSPDPQASLPPRAASAFSMYRPSDELRHERPRPESAASRRRMSSNASGNGPAGRPLAQEPRSASVRKTVFPSQVLSRSFAVSPVPSYRENDERLQEKTEARQLRDALQDLDLNDEVRLHAAAQDEATELVWMHQNPGMAYKNPYAPYRNPDIKPQSMRHSIGSPSQKSSGSSSNKFRHSVGSSGSSNQSSPEMPEATRDKTRRRSSLAGSLKKNLKVNFALPEEPQSTNTTPKPRTVSGDSSKGVFKNPNDHIYEEPLDPAKEEEIHPATGAPREDIPTKDGIEIRGDDIRAATSKKLKDRSESLPMPSAVSDRVGRPIVSFDPKWRPGDAPKPNPAQAGSHSAPVTPAAPTIEVVPSIEVSQHSVPPVPTIVGPDDDPSPPVPVINVPDIKTPTISEYSTPAEQQGKPTSRHAPAPAIRNSQQLSLQRNRSEPQTRWQTPYTRSGVPTARCESCSLSISGKIVTAGGCRFHPECFACFHCQTPLECVAFYEEPQASREERLANSPEEDRVPRFYCHLDFHELYSPRCKSCKTPIEGEVVVACGAEWHVGHFFCAECGDPFNSTTPFVEKDGCKQHVLDELVVSAIGGQWHERCFVCHECGDGFGSEGRFFVREGEPKRTAKGRIIGGPVQHAVCERCEGIRLKAAGMC
ncbi:hypothetical protein N7470_000109 [Penicillium chermesinum]|nr:hypothetical protein N7470_000109 [Penicillium chermesinum]